MSAPEGWKPDPPDPDVEPLGPLHPASLLLDIESWTPEQQQEVWRLLGDAEFTIRVNAITTAKPVAWRVTCASGEVNVWKKVPSQSVLDRDGCGPHRIEPMGVIHA